MSVTGLRLRRPVSGRGVKSMRVNMRMSPRSELAVSIQQQSWVPWGSILNERGRCNTCVATCTFLPDAKCFVRARDGKIEVEGPFALIVVVARVGERAVRLHVVDVRLSAIIAQASPPDRLPEFPESSLVFFAARALGRSLSPCDLEPNANLNEEPLLRMR